MTVFNLIQLIKGPQPNLRSSNMSWGKGNAYPFDKLPIFHIPPLRRSPSTFLPGRLPEFWRQFPNSKEAPLTVTFLARRHRYKWLANPSGARLRPLNCAINVRGTKDGKKLVGRNMKQLIVLVMRNPCLKWALYEPLFSVEWINYFFICGL